MSQAELDVITQAQEYIRSKQLPKAQRLLVQYIKKSPNSEQAWFVLSTAVDDPRKQIECLQRVLRINPANKEAQARLMKVMAAPAAPPPEPSHPAPPAAVSPTPASEPTFGAAPSMSVPPIEKPAPISEPQPIEPVPVEVSKPIEPVSTVDTELSSLRSKAKFVKPRAPRKRWPRIVMLLLLVLLAASVGGYLLARNYQQAGNPQGESTPQAVVIAPTNTPTVTSTPTVTPTPSITPTRYPPTWTPTPSPTVPPTRTPTPLPTFIPTVEAGLSRLGDQVAALRGFGNASDIPTALLSSDLLESALRSVLDIQGRQPELVNQARGLAALGLIRPGFDLSRYAMNRFADNAGGFYVPWQNVINVVGKQFGSVGTIVYVHQLAHGLLNQRFSFAQWGTYPTCASGDDRCHAQQALIEGDADLTTDNWLAKHTADLSKGALPQYQALLPAIDDPSAPPFVIRDVAFRSEYGRKFIDALYQSGGWTAVNAAYTNPPVSTEQIMHPDKYLKGQNPITVTPAALTNAFGSDWQIIVDESLGEWRTYLLLSASVDEAARLSDDTSRKAAAGWGGDRYQVYYDPQTDQSALVVQWVWDTPQDATEFNQAMGAYLDLRFRGAKSQVPNQACWSANQQATCLYSSDKGTLWVLAPEASLVDQVRQAYPDFK